MRETSHDIASELDLIDDQDLNNFYLKLSNSREILKKEALIKKQERFSDFLEVVNSQTYKEKKINVQALQKNSSVKKVELDSMPLVANQLKRDSFEEKGQVASEEENDDEEEEEEKEEELSDDHNQEINYE